ncbi:hypothetical protein [Kangiella koreensis]|uniref:Lipocalin-like domain-containing protein n=1 Tax=Kangiella koreensis (strain DSM 16069 / JCM 12317 / KCTC 12182 / SW-125) TaxID=523791 RepID=C7R981_KANKD|nr:hypothetical protein [Kangiella koreensis]ACV27871.1 hypothetical protein Kkor_2462 [Kangiella koreensis DSM 16069]
MKLILPFIMLLISQGLFAAELSPIRDAKVPISKVKESQREMFIGEWMSVQETENGHTRKAITKRAADGNYTIIFELYSEKGDLVFKQEEFGLWGVSGGIYFTIFQGSLEDNKPVNSDPTNANNYDAYKIVKASKQELVYQSLSSGDIYTYQKVESDSI